LIVFFRTWLHSIVFHCVLLYDTESDSAVFCWMLFVFIVFYCISNYIILFFSTSRYCIAFCCILLHIIVFHCISAYLIVLYCILQYAAVFYHISMYLFCLAVGCCILLRLFYIMWVFGFYCMKCILLCFIRIHRISCCFIGFYSILLYFIVY